MVAKSKRFDRVAVGSIVIRCFEYDRMFAFWQAALGYEVEHTDPNGGLVILRDPDRRGPNVSIDQAPARRSGAIWWRRPAPIWRGPIRRHIGYVVVPEFRRQGHATTILRMALHLAHEKLGIGRVLVTYDDDNIGSIRTIENNGGVLEDVISGPGLDKPKRRYWIDVRAGTAQ